ncbi:hypothetical protein HETIRDRAFT_104466 [Heterobasidion irregulare TC 32-1]|uniref:Uncharacterized protein n=1 Tax=Heterobasidion irregulare (strain TC 32-1) TaxID=747525 RepID=W4K029_HETIT|nr:uncharacterized protein HETIRDRAFT_104466 [Heterobasidion irregulare TC 32-1]ETW79178.1 hypothetical protein HETIRDRAFT_104466 [Heterobasidion irregulare TC 32-1]
MPANARFKKPGLELLPHNPSTVDTRPSMPFMSSPTLTPSPLIQAIKELNPGRIFPNIVVDVSMFDVDRRAEARTAYDGTRSALLVMTKTSKFVAIALLHARASSAFGPYHHRSLTSSSFLITPSSHLHT